MGGELWCGQAHNGVNLDFQDKFDLEGQGRSVHKTIGTLTKVFYIFCPNLVVLAGTGSELSHGQASDWQTDRQTDRHTHTDAGNDNTRRPNLASGKNDTVSGFQNNLFANHAMHFRRINSSNTKFPCPFRSGPSGKKRAFKWPLWSPWDWFRWKKFQGIPISWNLPHLGKFAVEWRSPLFSHKSSGGDCGNQLCTYFVSGDYI